MTCFKPCKGWERVAIPIADFESERLKSILPNAPINTLQYSETGREADENEGPHIAHVAGTPARACLPVPPPRETTTDRVYPRARARECRGSQAPVCRRPNAPHYPGSPPRPSGPQGRPNALGPAGLSSAPKHAGPPLATRRLGGREPAPPRSRSARGWARRRSRGCLRPPAAPGLRSGASAEPGAGAVRTSARKECSHRSACPQRSALPCSPSMATLGQQRSRPAGRIAGQDRKALWFTRFCPEVSARTSLPGHLCPDIDLWGIGTQPRSTPDSPSTKAGCPMS